MDKIFICSPYRGNVQKNLENAKRYCRYLSYEGIPIAPHLYFTQFLDEKYDRDKGMRWGKALLAECKRMYVFADEVTEGMIEEILEARKLKVPIKFYDADMQEIKYEALLINNRIGMGYKQIIEETVNPNGGKYVCPYAGNCNKSCAKAMERKEPESSKPMAMDTKKNNWKSKLLDHLKSNNEGGTRL